MTDYGDNPALRTVFVDSRASKRHLRKARLRVVSGPDAGREIEIGKSKAYVGRSKVNDLVMADKSISGTHFEIAVEEGGYLLRDLGSTNGVTADGLRLKEAYLKPGCSFSAGNSKFTFEPSDDVVEIALSDQDRFGDILGRSVVMREIFATLEKVAPSDLTVLVQGETGTGKERVASSVHMTSRRKRRPFVVLDCSSIPRDLMESTVFGHEKGSFTGAINQHKGAFEQANGGTIFMDEIGELDINLQPKLLRVLENRELKRVGGDKTIRVDVRVIAATNRDLRKMVADGQFREDLYFRLSVIQIVLPPLRDRQDDIDLLSSFFLDEFRSRHPDGKRFKLAEDAQQLMHSHAWPGNVRELKNVMERAVSLADGEQITRRDLHLTGSPRPLPTASQRADDGGSGGSYAIDTSLAYKDAKQDVLDGFERAYMAELIENHKGNISQAARAAGLTRYHLRELLKKHDLVKAR